MHKKIKEKKLVAIPTTKHDLRLNLHNETKKCPVTALEARMVVLKARSLATVSIREPASVTVDLQSTDPATCVNEPGQWRSVMD